MADDALSLTFAALADPTRRAILARLRKGAAGVNELAAPLPISLPAVSRHLRVLERAGLITQSRAQQWRPRQLAAAPLRDAAAWLGTYQDYWEGGLAKLAVCLEEDDNGK